MATDTRAPLSLTLADLCQAIEDCDIAITLRDGQYELNGRDVRRLQRLRADHRTHRDIPIDALVEHELSASEMGRPA